MNRLRTPLALLSLSQCHTLGTLHANQLFLVVGNLCENPVLKRRLQALKATALTSKSASHY